MKSVSEELSKLEVDQNNIEKKYLKLATSIPNLIHESVPIGEDEESNKEI